jgi:uncharacterized protein YkwD
MSKTVSMVNWLILILTFYPEGNKDRSFRLPGISVEVVQAMLGALITALALVLPAAADPPNPERSPAYDSGAEQRLLELTNQERQKSGAPPLRLDPGLTEAARQHAALLASKGELSHRFPGEPPLIERLGKASPHLNDAGENVAFDSGVERAHQDLMHSPPHRRNLLNPKFNVVGFGAIRVGDRIYVTEDFGRKVKNYPVAEAENRVADAIARTRTSDGGPRLHRVESESLRKAACSMASHDRLNAKTVSGIGGLHYVITYTNLEPESLPANIERPLQDGHVRSFAVGACFAHSPSYPGGTYWVAVAFY